MEKFSNWRDKGTGISPFVPVPEPPQTFIRKLCIVPSSILFLIKLPILLVSSLIYYILPLNIIGKFIVVVLFGLKRLDFSIDGVKRSKTKEISSSRPNLNDFIVVNYISPLDGIVLSVISQVSWKNIVILIPNKNGELFEYSIWSFINHSFSKNIGQETSNKKVEDLAKLKNKLIFLFIEGTPSNNKSVLPFISSFTSSVNIASNFSFKTLVLKLQPGYLTLSIPVISKVKYLFKVLTNLNNSSCVKFKMYKHEQFSLNEIRKSFELSSLNIIGNDLNLAEKEKFYNYFVDYKVKKD